MGLASPNPSSLKIDKGMRLILAPKSHRALSKIKFPILHGIVKFLGSFNLCGNFLRSIVLHSSVRFTVSKSDNLLFFDSISFINLT